MVTKSSIIMRTTPIHSCDASVQHAIFRFVLRVGNWGNCGMESTLIIQDLLFCGGTRAMDCSAVRRTQIVVMQVHGWTCQCQLVTNMLWFSILAICGKCG